ncbi:MAG: response regulator, partial [Veillonellaceae bacterium]|nr:response regulator [Veillonellaceae bacterium]
MTSEMLNTKEIDDILQVIRKVYHTIIYVDLGDGSYHCIQTSEQGIKALLEKRDFEIQSLTEYLTSSGLVYAEDAREFAEFFDLDKMRQLLDDGKEYLSITYRRAKGGRYRWDMLEVIPSREYNDKHRGIVICVRDINEEHQRELDKEAKLSLKEKQLVGDKTILIVDDSELQRTTLSYFLDRYYKTMELANGQEALDYLRKHSTEVSAILLDLNMPIMDGYTFLQEFQKDEILNMIPVLVLTSDSTPEEEAECLKDGATDFVAKPFNPDVLLSRIQRAIALHEKTVMLNILRLDNQTNCYTRDYFMHMAEHVLAKYPDEEFDLVCTHVVNLANINEQYGTNQGEAILRYVAQNHDVSEFERNIFGRLDDATFVQLLPHSVNIHQKLVEQQVEEFHEYEQVKAGLPPFMQKFGIYERVDHNLPVSVMCDRAVMALDKIKNVYKQRVKVYDESLRSRALKSQQILENMEEAITKHQFQVWYQPKHNIQTGKLVGAEALVRWIHPKYGFMSPADFVPIFEENGFVSHMDYYVWEESCAAMERWKKQQLKTVPVSLNISR